MHAKQKTAEPFLYNYLYAKSSGGSFWYTGINGEAKDAPQEYVITHTREQSHQSQHLKKVKKGGAVPIYKCEKPLIDI